MLYFSQKQAVKGGGRVFGNGIYKLFLINSSRYYHCAIFKTRMSMHTYCCRCYFVRFPGF